MIVIGGSAGSFPVVSDLLAQLPKKFPLPIILGMHRLKHIRNGFAEALQLRSKIPVLEVEDKDKIRAGFAYVAPANYHLIFLIVEDKINSFYSLM